MYRGYTGRMRLAFSDITFYLDVKSKALLSMKSMIKTLSCNIFLERGDLSIYLEFVEHCAVYIRVLFKINSFLCPSTCLQIFLRLNKFAI